MNVYQSYMSTVLKARLNLYECRLLLKIIERGQDAIKSQRISMLIDKKVDIEGLNLSLHVEIKELLGDSNKHYKEVRDAAVSLETKIIEHYDRNTRKWYSTPLIYNVILTEGSGIIRFSCARWLMEYILDFSQGFTEYNFVSAMRLSTSYSIRFYMIFASLSRPVQYNVDLLKTIMGVEDKYKQTRDFIKRVLEPAAQELEKEKLNGFTIKPIKDKGKITKIEFVPVKRQQKSESELTAMASLSAWCTPILKSYLVNRCDFSSRELSAHKTLLMRFGNLPIWQEMIEQIIERQRRKRAGKGYVISGMRNVLKDWDSGKYKPGKK